MPRQNRVTPFGAIVAVPERGTFMGNRGILHDAGGHVKRAWQVTRWLVCVLDFRGRKRAVMTPNRYTELFFLDEATALAAGHRPCAECRHDRFIAYCNAWRTANPGGEGGLRPTVALIDSRLHAERLMPDRSKRSFMATMDDLPNGVFVQLEGPGEDAYLLCGASLLRWSPGGYHERRTRPKRASVKVLTPKSTVKVLGAGYVPEVHPSAGLS